MTDEDAMRSDPSTEPLARAAAAGDASAFERAWGRLAPAVYAWAALHVRAPLRRRLDPEDVLQEVACRAWSDFGAWDPARGAFRGWVFGIARNVLREALRRLAREPVRSSPILDPTERLTALPDTATAVTRAVARDEGLLRFLVRVEELPDDERRLLVFRGLEGLTHAEVAVLSASTADAVAKRWQRLCERLRGEPAFVELMAS